MKPFLLHLAKHNDQDLWRVGFDLGEMVFYQEFDLRKPADFWLAVGKATKAVEHFQSLSEEDHAERIRKANALWSAE